ncbi:MAG: DUF6491 family protein [Caulobacteraceae bacterium]
MKHLVPAAVAALALAFAGVAAAQPPPAHHGRSCFWRRDIVNFAAHDDNDLYVRVGVGDVYRFHMFPGCLDLSWLHRLGVRTFGDSQICEGPSANVEIINRQLSTGRQRCPVTYVRKLTPPEVAALPRDARP